ncbi:MAG: hypothetical protein JW751_05130 [Polyangiaceae bacterium]|nr:hypothetical protein [Polyangiaceae bacterium]
MTPAAAKDSLTPGNSAHAGGSAAPAPLPRRRRLFYLFGCVGGLAVALGLGVVVVAMLVAVLLPPYLERRVQDEARARGFAIEFARMDPSLSSLKLEEVKLRLVGVPGIEAELDEVVLRLESLEPVAAAVHGARVRIVGAAPVLALALAEWTRAHPENFRVPFTASGAAVEWREAAKAAPWLVLGKGAVFPAPTGGVFSAEQARIAGISVGRVTASYGSGKAQVELGFGADSPANAPVEIVVEHAATSPAATVTLRPIPLGRLARPLGVPLPIAGVTASGTAKLSLPKGIQTGPINGTLHLELKGYLPPHPVELSGFVFGDTTIFDTKLAVSTDRLRTELTETSVTAGRFVVKGKGEVVRGPESATVRLALRGDLPCAALADAVAESRLGQELGRIAGRIAREMVNGSVTVFVKVEADTSRLAEAKLLRTIGVGCGLKPIPIPGLGTIDLSSLDLSSTDLADLPSLPPGLPTDLPTLPSALPTMPSAWSLPRVPTSFPLPSLGATARPRGVASSEP